MPRGFIMEIYLIIATLNVRAVIVTNAPTINNGRVIGPAPAGMKNPTTLDANVILDTSEKYLESNTT